MLRKRNISIKTVKELDAFPKIPDDYRKHSAVGGTFSIVSVIIILYIIYSETSYFLDTRLKFKFVPDIDVNDEIEMNVDITVAMPCASIGADVVDSTNKNLNTIGQLHEESTWWDLEPDQRAHFEALKHVNSYFREEYHAIHEILWKSNQLTYASGEVPKRIHTPSYPSNACRIYGSLIVNKVAGNFHITSGKALHLPRGHIHISAFMSERNYNFSHRINKFSFGKPSPGIIHPLEGDEKVTSDSTMLYQYFIEVVSTHINTFMRKTQTYQYSVKDFERPIDHDKGSHGIPGIFFKYDISALKVNVSQEGDSFIEFIVKLLSSIGCIYVTNGLLNNLVQGAWSLICCKFLKNGEEKSDEKVIVNTNTSNVPNKVNNLLTVDPPKNIQQINIVPES
ncbi:hypothetical protein TKK_0012744 [Trichogramma kaykai]|uniref:Endoplasmic reticulum-Golgi intermediate compartment protein 2 n=1 Tax=Trichogramma kaykai TaxID=54128 RepID=A0ABD2WLD7_9HYME